jgi:hypothetical protein
MLELFDPERYPGSTEDAYRRLEQVNAAYAQIRGVVADEVAPPEDAAEADGSIDDGDADGRVADVAENLVQIGFISGDARKPRNRRLRCSRHCCRATRGSPSHGRIAVRGW